MFTIAYNAKLELPHLFISRTNRLVHTKWKMLVFYTYWNCSFAKFNNKFHMPFAWCWVQISSINASLNKIFLHNSFHLFINIMCKNLFYNSEFNNQLLFYSNKNHFCLASSVQHLTVSKNMLLIRKRTNKHVDEYNNTHLFWI